MALFPGSFSHASPGASPAQAAACQQTYAEYQQCLAKVGRKNFSSCYDFYGKLRACEKLLKTNYCLEEGISLLSCVKNPDADFCSKQFLAMRECHRPGGPHLVAVVPPSFSSSKESIGTFAGAGETAASASAPVGTSAEWQQQQLLLQQQGDYELRPDVVQEYNVNSAVVGPATAPQGRCCKRLDAAADALKKQLHVPAEEFVAYKMESLRPRPGA